MQRLFFNFADGFLFMPLISDEGRLLQVTAGIKAGSGRKSADVTENELDTIMTPL